MTQENFADQGDLHIGFIKAIEKEGENPSLHDLANIAAVLRVEMFDLSYPCPSEETRWKKLKIKAILINEQRHG
jgi:transcriptional regulator with XRE-family HTH domain